eukprot:TRINITY_DN10457_c0_g2_i6.p1 TRINITY_DN10457_c0_g2~~TRINITY_DN10457_c0_g2_i6.p1  ORF type:complete len:101 (-),score=20.16 TRINITY_DN10457_c0_g2_i6:178-480(-)
MKKGREREGKRKGWGIGRNITIFMIITTNNRSRRRETETPTGELQTRGEPRKKRRSKKRNQEPDTIGHCGSENKYKLWKPDEIQQPNKPNNTILHRCTKQ